MGDCGTQEKNKTFFCTCSWEMWSPWMGLFESPEDFDENVEETDLESEKSRPVQHSRFEFRDK